MFRHSHTTPRKIPQAVAQTGHRSGRWRTLVVMLSMLLLLAVGRGFAADPKPVAEYQLKAALLPKVALFVQWPAKAFSAPGAPLVIGVFGENPFGPHLEDVARGQVIDGHPLSVQVCRDLQEAALCHLVFISGDNTKTMEETLRQLARAPVLTVSDSPNFATQGGMVNLVTINQKIRLEVNLEAIQRADLRIDPHLLQMVKLVKSVPSKTKP
jgi:YfiR/HmsC-like